MVGFGTFVFVACPSIIDLNFRDFQSINESSVLISTLHS